MKNVILFGARGHLARTKLIPCLKHQNIPYVPMSRQYSQNIDTYTEQQNIFYMSIPSQNLIECIEPHTKFIEENNPTFVLEKPHGISQENFQDIEDYFISNNLKVLYNDHYIAKDGLNNLEPVLESMKIEKIEVCLHEFSGVNDRIDYFDNVGIILDMYQSHVLIILSTIISKNTGLSRTEVLEELSQVKPYFSELYKYPGYKGEACTHCHVQLWYKGIDIQVSCGKKMPYDQKYVSINNEYNIDLSCGSYNPIFKWLMENHTRPFLNNYEVSLLWKHIG